MGARSAATTLQWGLIVAAALVAAVFGFAGFLQYVQDLPDSSEFAGATRADIAYYTAQLFVLDPAPLGEPGPYPVLLQIARFLAPATTIVAVVRTVLVLVRDRARQWAAARAKGHVIVAGNDPVALMLARRFAADRQRVVLMSDTVGEDVARQHGVYVVPGDPTQEVTLRAAGAPRAASVYACGPDSATNLAVALTTRRIAVRSVTVRAEIRDAQLFADLKAVRPAQRTEAELDMQVSFFVVEELAARVLLAQESLVAGYDEAAPVVILGAGPFGQAVARQLGRRRDPATAASVTLVPEEAVPDWAPPAGSAGLRLYLCLADPDLALRIALNQARSATGRVVLCLQQRSAFQDALSGTGSGLFDASGRLAVFGILDAACDAAPRDLVDELGRAVHDRYVQDRLAAGDTAATNASLVPWAKLPRHLKQSNWAHAGRIETKLATIGCAIVPAVQGAEPFAFRPGEVDQLARLEHELWGAERRAAGFVHGPVREGRFHPDLLDWEDLPQRTRDKDIDLTQQLPEILAEAGFQILRWQ